MKYYNLFFILLGSQSVITNAESQYDNVLKELNDKNFNTPFIKDKLGIKLDFKAESVVSEADSVIRERRISDKKTRLEFLHIAKTGGTSVEDAAIEQAGIRWGRCHFIACFHIESDNPNRIASIWHKPLYYLPNNFYGDDAALFVIVREPYERVISAYYYAGFHHHSINELNQREMLNNWVTDKLNCSIFRPNFYPAYNYVFDLGTHKEVVDYVLRFETFEEDFNYLMKEYSLNITLVHDNVHNKSDKLGVEDLSHESIQINNDYFYNDFATFGYEMK